MKRLISLVMLAGTVVATGCSRKLMVGVVLPETGDAAVYGASIKTGVKLAFDQAFADGTAPQGLVVEYRDSGSDPTRAASQADALYDAGALVIIGGATSPEAKAMIPLADKRSRILISPSASAPDLARMSVYFFRMYPSDDLEGVKAADLLTVTRGVESVLIVEQDNAYTRGLLPVFMGELRHQRGQIVGSISMDEPNWKQQVRDTIAARRPQGIFLVGYGDAILNALQVIRNTNYQGTICTTSAINTATFLQKAGRLAEGVFFPLATLDTSSEKEPVRSFVRSYYQTYQLIPDIYAAHGYDAALATLYALSNLHTRSGREVQIRLKGLAEKQGVTGPLAFDDYGNIKHYLRNHWIHNGKVEDYDTYIEREKEKLREQMMQLLQGRGN
jgi:branched-chain amino acid transport system substrate-binding protein